MRLVRSQYSSDSHWLSYLQDAPINADAGVDIIAGTKNENATRTTCSVVNKRWFENNIMERQNVAEKWEKFNSKYAEKKPPFVYDIIYVVGAVCMRTYGRTCRRRWQR